MAFLKMENVKISGISACVPKQIDENSLSSLFNRDELNNFTATIGVERKRKSPDTVCTSDLCVAAGLLNQNKSGGKALLLAGDTIMKTVSAEDKSTYPLFGDAGTATALEYMPDAEPMLFTMNSDGSGYEMIIIYDGGYRNPFSVSSLEKRMQGGIVSNNIQGVLNGMDVFSFGIKEALKSVNRLNRGILFK
jgi:3-oxoacyl-[acyl-carrier-protein] synthase III